MSAALSTMSRFNATNAVDNAALIHPTEWLL
jgi:hypothetical protein